MHGYALTKKTFAILVMAFALTMSTAIPSIAFAQQAQTAAVAKPDERTVADAYTYWSVILVGVPDYRVVPNSLNRFNFNSYSRLTKEPDGSLKIAIGPNPVKGVPETNWLPSAPGKCVSLTFRAYVPKDIVKQGQWAPPAVTGVH